jgi:hypothetical protein
MKPKNEKTPKFSALLSRFPVFGSMAECAGALKLPKARLQMAKRAGCPAFDSHGRVDSAKLLGWLLSAEGAGESTDWPDRLKRAQALMAEMELEAEGGRLVSRAWVNARFQRVAGEINGIRYKSENEHPLLFAAALGDTAKCRTAVRGIWDEILKSFADMAKHFAEGGK